MNPLCGCMIEVGSVRAIEFGPRRHPIFFVGGVDHEQHCCGPARGNGERSGVIWEIANLTPADVPNPMIWDARQPAHSPLMFASLRIGHHFSISALWSAASL